MKKIIGNKLYDTEKAEKIYSYIITEKTQVGFMSIPYKYHIDVYKTKKGAYFKHTVPEGYDKKETIDEMTLEEVKQIIKQLNPDRYIELGFEVIIDA